MKNIMVFCFVKLFVFYQNQLGRRYWRFVGLLSKQWSNLLIQLNFKCIYDQSDKHFLLYERNVIVMDIYLDLDLIKKESFMNRLSELGEMRRLEPLMKLLKVSIVFFLYSKKVFLVEVQIIKSLLH